MNDPILGAVADFAILKADGTMVDYGKRHNIWSGWGNVTSRSLYMTTTDYTFYTHTQFGTTLLDGTYTLSGDRVYRSTGNVLMNSTSAMTTGDYIEFPSGFKAYAVVTNINLSTIQVSLSGSIPTPTQLIRHKTNTQPFNANEQIGASQTGGAWTTTLTITPSSVSRSLSGLFTPTPTPYTINSIVYRVTSTISGYFPITPPITLNTGDSLYIKDFKNTLTTDIGLPRVFTNNDQIVGLSGSGTIQKFLNQTTDLTSSYLPNRILLMDNANKIPAISGTPYSANIFLSLTANRPTEIIPTFDMNTDSLPTNNNNKTSSTHIYGVTLSGGLISQIVTAFFSANQYYILNVINYDTPVTIPVDKVLSIRNTARLVVETPL